MAFYDWNGDGKRDSADNYIEYQIYKHSTDKNINNGYSSGKNGISTIGAIMATIGGFFGACAILTLFGGGDDISVIGVIILWAICGSGLGVWFEKIGF